MKGLASVIESCQKVQASGSRYSLSAGGNVRLGGKIKVWPRMRGEKAAHRRRDATHLPTQEPWGGGGVWVGGGGGLVGGGGCVRINSQSHVF